MSTTTDAMKRTGWAWALALAALFFSGGALAQSGCGPLEISLKHCQPAVCVDYGKGVFPRMLKTVKGWKNGRCLYLERDLLKGRSFQCGMTKAMHGAIAANDVRSLPFDLLVESKQCKWFERVIIGCPPPGRYTHGQEVLGWIMEVNAGRGGTETAASWALDPPAYQGYKTFLRCRDKRTGPRYVSSLMQLQPPLKCEVVKNAFICIKDTKYRPQDEEEEEEEDTGEEADNPPVF